MDKERSRFSRRNILIIPEGTILPVSCRLSFIRYISHKNKIGTKHNQTKTSVMMIREENWASFHNRYSSEEYRKSAEYDRDLGRAKLSMSCNIFLKRQLSTRHQIHSDECSLKSTRSSHGTISSLKSSSRCSSLTSKPLLLGQRSSSSRSLSASLSMAQRRNVPFPQ